jgi:hypothetical protein
MTKLTSQQMRLINGGSMSPCGDLLNAITVLMLFGQEIGAAILLGYYISQGC